MNTKRIGCFVLIFIIFYSLSFLRISPAQAQMSRSFKVIRASWGEDLNSPIKAYPGDTNVPLLVEAQNLSPNESVKGVTGLLMLEDGRFTDIYGNINTTAVAEPEIGDVLDPTDEILPKGFFTLTFTIDIAENTPPGTYQYEMILSYSINSSGIFNDGEPLMLNVMFTVSAIVSSLVCSVSPEIIELGDTVEVAGSVTPAREDAIIALAFKAPNGSTFNLTSKTDAAGSYEMFFEPEIEGSWGVNASWVGDMKTQGDWVSASFQVRNPVSLNIETSDTQLIGGIYNDFTITLLNDGEVHLKKLEATLSIPSPLVVADTDRWAIDNLAPANSSTFMTQIFVPESNIGSTYAGSLTVAYEDEYGASYTNDHPIGLILIGRIEMAVYSVAVFPLSASPGAEISITATLLNKGNVPARFVNASILPNGLLNLTGESSTYIGEVEENAPSPFTLAAALSTDAPTGEAPITIRIAYIDDQYNDHFLTITPNLNVKPSENGQPGSGETDYVQLWLQFGVVFLTLFAISIAIIILFRRRSNQVSTN